MVWNNYSITSAFNHMITQLRFVLSPLHSCLIHHNYHGDSTYDTGHTPRWTCSSVSSVFINSERSNHNFMMVTIKCRSGYDLHNLPRFYLDNTINCQSIVALWLLDSVVSCRYQEPDAQLRPHWMLRRLFSPCEIAQRRSPSSGSTTTDRDFAMKKRPAQEDWTGGNPAIKAALYGWLACIHWRQDTNVKQFPDTPALGNLFASANQNRWTDQCYQEILSLGNISGITFAQYTQGLPQRVGRAGCCRALPITFEEDELKVEVTQTASNLMEGSTSRPPTEQALGFTEQTGRSIVRKGMSRSEFQRFVWENFTEKCT